MNKLLRFLAMSYVTLEVAKSHLAVVLPDDDSLIQQCVDAAESHCASLMNRPEISDTQPVATPWVSPDGKVPKAVVQAVLLYTAEFYEVRGVSVIGLSVTRSPTADALLHFHRVGLGV